MAVLIEGISVVIRCEAIARNYKGGHAVFAAEVPNRSLRADGELAGVTFLTPDEARRYVEHLESRGLTYRDSGVAKDLVVVDQKSGFRVPCDWAEFGATSWNNDQSKLIAVCATSSLGAQKVVVPNGWSFTASLSARSRFAEGGSVPDNLKLIGREQGIDVYLDENTGEQFYVSRDS